MNPRVVERARLRAMWPGWVARAGARLRELDIEQQKLACDIFFEDLPDVNGRWSISLFATALRYRIGTKT